MTVSNRKSVTIIVTTHKPYRMPGDSMYLPLYVGAALAKPADPSSPDDPRSYRPDPGYVQDNLGENISTRNPQFCELTGLFWAWKHVRTDFIGLVHYRRHFRGKDTSPKSGIVNDIFDKVIRYRELEPMLHQYRVFVPTKRHYIIETLYSHYDHTHYVEHLDKTRDIIKRKYPEYLPAFDRVMHQRSAHMFNMMIMERGLLNEYCTWLFDILFTLEREVDPSNYSFYQGRYAGRVGELIFNVWLRYQVDSGHLLRSDIKVLPFLYTERVNWVEKAAKFVRAKYFHRKYDDR